jgi:hypothetical protein
MIMTVYVLKLSSGAFDEYRQCDLGVFSSDDRANKAKASIEAEIQREKEATFKDTSWFHPSDAEEWQIDELSDEDLRAWYDFHWEKSFLESINSIWVEPFILDENNFTIKDLI